MKLIFASLLALGLFAQTVTANETRGTACNGCSNAKMYRVAGNTVDQGTVFVFNVSNRKIKRYSVFTETIDEQPLIQWSQVVELKVPWTIKRDFYQYVDLRDEIDDSGIIVLPPNFPIRSVAGAMADPAFATTTIEDYVRSLSQLRQMELTVSSLFAKLLQNSVPAVDLKNVLKSIVLRVQFPDGSYMDFQISLSFNSVSGKSQLELESMGNIHTADGQAAPTSAYTFDGRTFHDDNGSLREWIAWAQQLGLTVYGRNGTVMTCEVVEDVIICRVRQSS